jgi:hypothetical protein
MLALWNAWVYAIGRSVSLSDSYFVVATTPTI